MSDSDKSPDTIDESQLDSAVQDKIESLLEDSAKEALPTLQPEPAPEPIVLRQWVSAPGGSCDVRLGEDAITLCGSMLKTAVGKPHKAGLLVQEGSDEELVEKLRRELTNAGFVVTHLSMPKGKAALSAKEILALWEQFGAMELTGDDIVLATGDAEGLSLATHACATWTKGVALAVVARSISEAIQVMVTPLALTVGEHERMVSSHAAIKYVLCDTNYVPANLHEDTPDGRLARAYMVQAAMCDGEQAFQKLWDNVDELMAGDKQTCFKQAVETLKSRGKIISSSSLAIKNSLGYGEVFAYALIKLAGVDLGTGIAEGMRFCARLSCAEEKMSVDDVLLQDELLEHLQLPEAKVKVDPEALVAALKEECFLRQGRFMLELPQVIGRVRLSALEDELLLEHTRAWCEYHASL